MCVPWTPQLLKCRRGGGVVHSAFKNLPVTKKTLGTKSDRVRERYQTVCRKKDYVKLGGSSRTLFTKQDQLKSEDGAGGFCSRPDRYALSVDRFKEKGRGGVGGENKSWAETSDAQGESPVNSKRKKALHPKLHSRPSKTTSLTLLLFPPPSSSFAKLIARLTCHHSGHRNVDLWPVLRILDEQQKIGFSTASQASTDPPLIHGLLKFCLWPSGPNLLQAAPTWGVSLLKVLKSIFWNPLYNGVE